MPFTAEKMHRSEPIRKKFCITCLPTHQCNQPDRSPAPHRQSVPGYLQENGQGGKNKSLGQARGSRALLHPHLFSSIWPYRHTPGYKDRPCAPCQTRKSPCSTLVQDMGRTADKLFQIRHRKSFANRRFRQLSITRPPIHFIFSMGRKPSLFSNPCSLPPIFHKCSQCQSRHPQRRTQPERYRSIDPPNGRHRHWYPYPQ